MQKHWRELVYGLFVAAGLLLIVLQPFRYALDSRGHLALTGMLLTTGLWILEPFHISVGVGSCLLFAFMLAVGIPAKYVFSGFTQTAVWTMIPALFFGFALQKTGLGKRIAYFFLKSIHRVTAFSLIIAWALIGIVLSVMTPSITVRVVIAMPLALNCVELCGFSRKSKERSLILLFAWSMLVVPGIGWPTGSLLGPVLTGIFGSVEGIPEITFENWCRVTLLPTAVITALLLTESAILLKRGTVISFSRETFLSAYQELEPLGRDGKITLAVLCGCFVLLATNFLHGIADAAVCLLGFFILCAFGVIDKDEISSGISWNIVLFVGASMSIGEIFSYTGVSGWLSDVLMPVFGKVTNPYVLIFVMMFLLFIWRFVDVALLTPTIVIIAPVIPLLWQTHGIHPTIWIPVFSFVICAFFMRYQNMFLLIGETVLGEDGWKPQERFQYALMYFVNCFAAVAIAMPYWKACNLIM